MAEATHARALLYSTVCMRPTVCIAHRAWIACMSASRAQPRIPAAPPLQPAPLQVARRHRGLLPRG